MVQFEEMIKQLELREVLIRFLEQKAHPWINHRTGLDMDRLQALIFQRLPHFNMKYAFATFIGSVIFWQISFVVLHYLIQVVLRALKAAFPSNENILKLGSKDQWKYTQCFHGILHAVFAVVGAVFGLLYADGQYGTTWFHCNYYKLHMFDSQRYLSMFSVGFYVQSLLVSLQNATSHDTNQMQIYLHHVLVIFGNLLALWLGGFFGSCSQVSLIVEASTPFVAFKQIMTMHRRDDTMLFKVNSMVMTLAFFVFRTCFFYYMVFWKCQDFMMYRFVSFWQTYPPNKWKWCKLCFVMFCMVYMLNLFWFSKMLWGLMQGLGIDKAIQDTERVLEEEDDSSDEDEKLKQD